MPNEIDFRHIIASLLDVRGRLSRGGFWLAYAAAFGFSLITLPFLIPFLSLKRPELTMPIAMLVWSPVMLMLLLAMIRRLHDRGKSGWSLLAAYGPMLSAMLLTAVFQIFPGDGPLGYAVILLMLAAMAGTLWLQVQIFVLAGTQGPNRFGPDPLQSEGGGALRRAFAFLAPR
jgi:uncharacterized membrane protein YhaH (DUF805 family)